MNNLTIQTLTEKYPEYFESCFDFSIGKGWLPLVKSFIEEYENWLSRQDFDNQEVKDNPLRFLQLKEKFGELRLYYMGPMTRHFDSVTWFIERASKNICEECGAYANTVSQGWIRYLCQPCMEVFRPEGSWEFKKDRLDCNL